MAVTYSLESDMPQIITKVNNTVKPDDKWVQVLTDVRQRIDHLNSLIPVIERKIKQGEVWPGDQPGTPEHK